MVVAFVILGVIISILLNKCQQKISKEIKNEERVESIKREENFRKEAETQKITEVQTEEKISLPYEMKYIDIDLLYNREEYSIIEFKDDREKMIYGCYGIWTLKEDNTKFKQGCYYLNDYGDMESEKTPLSKMEDSDYNSYLVKKSYVEKIGIEQCYEDFTNPLKLIFDLCQKEAVYNNRYVSDELVKKYPKGLLNDFDYDTVEHNEEYTDYEFDDRLQLGNQPYTSVLIKKGNKITRIVMVPYINKEGMLEDIEIREIKEIIDERGEITKLKMDEYNWLNCIERLAFGDDEEVGKSQKFIEKHPNFNGIIPNTLDEFPQHLNQFHVKTVNNESDYKNKIIALDFYDKRLGKTTRYIISYETDAKMYVDKIEIISKEMISEDEYNNTLEENSNLALNFDCKVRLIDKDRNISKLPITENFINNNFVKLSEIHRIEMIDFKSPRKNNKIALTLYDINRNKHFYGLTFKIVDNLIDDVTVTPLDITEFPEGNAAFDLF